MKEALKLALEALERSVATCFVPYAHRQVMSQPDHFINKAIRQAKEALREHDMREVQRLGQEIKQEPVVGIVAITTWLKDGRHVTRTPCDSWADTTPPQRTEQEPVATVESVATVVSESGNQEVTMSWWHEPALPVGTKLYTTPPKQEPVKYSDYEPDGVHHTTPPQEQQSCDKRTWERPWVSLTDEERKKIMIECESTGDWAWELKAAQAIEAKLKEKNT